MLRQIVETFHSIGDMCMSVRNLRTPEKGVLVLAAFAIVWFGFIERGYLPLPRPPLDPLAPLILFVVIVAIYWLLARVYILVARRQPPIRRSA